MAFVCLATQGCLSIRFHNLMRHNGTYEDVVLAWKVIVISYIGPLSKSKQYLHNIFLNQANGHLLQLPKPEERTCNGYCWVNTVVHQLKSAQTLDFMIPNELQYMSLTQSLESFCTTNLSWVLTKSDLTHKFMWLKFWNWGMTYTYHNVLVPLRLK